MQEKQRSNNQPRNNKATTNPDLQPPRTHISQTQIPWFELQRRLQVVKVVGNNGKDSKRGKSTRTKLPFPLLSELPWPSLLGFSFDNYLHHWQWFDLNLYYLNFHGQAFGFGYFLNPWFGLEKEKRRKNRNIIFARTRTRVS